MRLVDPDNRRPVDYAERQQTLARLEKGGPLVPWNGNIAGEAKLWLIRSALHLRKRQPESFSAGGTYRPIYADGPEAQHVVSFERGTAVVTVVPRLQFQRAVSVATTLDLPDGSWRDVMTGHSWTGRVSLPELWRGFPVAILERELPVDQPEEYGK